MRIHAVRDASVAGAARAHTSVGALLLFLVKRETCIHPTCALRLVPARAWRHPREDGEQRRRPGRWRRAAPRRPRVPREPCRRPQRLRQWDVAVRFSVQWAFLGLTYAVRVSGLSLFVTKSCPTTRRCHGSFSLPLPAGTWAACSRNAAALSVVPEVSGHARSCLLGTCPGVALLARGARVRSGLWKPEWPCFLRAHSTRVRAPVAAHPGRRRGLSVLSISAVLAGPWWPRIALCDFRGPRVHRFLTRSALFLCKVSVRLFCPFEKPGCRLSVARRRGASCMWVQVPARLRAYPSQSVA